MSSSGVVVVADLAPSLAHPRMAPLSQPSLPDRRGEHHATSTISQEDLHALRSIAPHPTRARMDMLNGSPNRRASREAECYVHNVRRRHTRHIRTYRRIVPAHIVTTHAIPQVGAVIDRDLPIPALRTPRGMTSESTTGGNKVASGTDIVCQAAGLPRRPPADLPSTNRRDVPGGPGSRVIWART